MKRFLLLLSFFSSIFLNATERKAPGDSLKILFVGNSLTYTNNLPALVEEMGAMDGKIINTHSIVIANYSIEDHWNEGVAEAEIEKGKYDFVVFQQGPSALPESQFLLLEYAGRFAKVCQENNAKMALYMVWPSKSRLFDLDNVILSYTNAAKKTGSLLCSAGLAWKYTWQASPSTSLYGPDGFHPGMDGSVLAALTVYGVLVGKKDFNFVEYSKCSWKADLDKNKFEILVTAALKAMK